MKTFQQYLEEGRDAPLYHGIKSYYSAMILIYVNKVIEPRTKQDKWKLLKITKKDYSTSKTRLVLNGISLTRDIEYAKLRSDSFGNPDTAIVLKLDQKKLSQKYQIVPLQYWQSFSNSYGAPARTPQWHTLNEAEEFLITDKPISVDKYVTEILIGKRVLSDLSDNKDIYEEFYQKLKNDRRVRILK